MHRDYTLFKLQYDIGGYVHNSASPEEKQQIEKNYPMDYVANVWSDLLFREHRPYARYHILNKLADLVREKKIQLPADQLQELIEQFQQERNQWISDAFAHVLDYAEPKDMLLRLAKEAKLEVTRWICVHNLQVRLSNSFRAGPASSQKYDKALEKELRDIVLSDPSNVVRNVIVQGVLSFEESHPLPYVEFCRQWYYAASAALGKNESLGKDKPRIPDYFADEQRPVLAPIRAVTETPAQPLQHTTPQPNPNTAQRYESRTQHGATLTHNTTEKTHKFIKKQQSLAGLALALGIGVTIFGPPEVRNIALVAAGVSAVWLIFVIPWLKWWHHG